MTGYTRFFDEVVRLEIRLWHRLEKLQAADGAASLAQFQALRAVHSGRGSTRVYDIATELHVTVGAASKLVDRLERGGLARRTSNPVDRRSMFIGLTVEGERVMKRAEATIAQNMQRILGATLTDDDAEERAAALSKISWSLAKEEDQ